MSNAKALYEEAAAAHSEGNFARAAEIYEQLADDGESYGLVLLARLYIDGEGTSVSLQKAEELLQKAMKMGEDEAFLQMAAVCHARNDLPKYFHAMAQAANAGILTAKYRLGLCYARGIGTTQDQLKALQTIREAAAEGHVRARLYLAKRRIARPIDPLGFSKGVIQFLVAMIGGIALRIADRDDPRVR